MNPERALMPGSRASDATGKTAEQRFAEIRKYFLEMLAFSGSSRAELYSRPKPGEAREPTEEEIVRRWAQAIHVSVNDICIGIQRAFMGAADRGQVVTSFRYCVPHIVARCNELRESRSGMGSIDGGDVGVNPKALERIRRREADRLRARRVLGEKE